MDREHWAELSAAISLVDSTFADNPDYLHRTAVVVRCHCWSALHDRPTRWAADGRNWGRPGRPAALPSQPTLSRRLRSAEFEAFMTLLERRLAPPPGAPTLFKSIDGKPLAVAMHSKDRDATFGRGAGQPARGYKLHAVWGGGAALPLQWRVAPLNVGEQRIAGRMLKRLGGHPGYVAADKNYDSNRLFDLAGAAHNQLVCPRRKGADKGLGRCRQSPWRLRSKDLLENPTRRLTRFGPGLMKGRGTIERAFGNLTGFGGGLQCLPPWVRRYGRVKRWVWAKLLINAARIRVKRRKSSERE